MHALSAHRRTGHRGRRFSPSAALPWLVIVAVLVGFPALSAETGTEVRFNRDIRPIMSDTCFKCHGPGTREAGLRLDVRDQALKAAESGGTPIVPGKPDQGEVVRRVLADDPDEAMPPPEANKTLTAEQKELIRRWVQQGAPNEKHWSFEPPMKVDSPRVDGAAFRIHNPIDAFVADRLQREGLTMSPEADRGSAWTPSSCATTPCSSAG